MRQRSGRNLVSPFAFLCFRLPDIRIEKREKSLIIHDDRRGALRLAMCRPVGIVQESFELALTFLLCFRLAISLPNCGQLRRDVLGLILLAFLDGSCGQVDRYNKHTRRPIVTEIAVLDGFEHLLARFRALCTESSIQCALAVSPQLGRL